MKKAFKPSKRNVSPRLRECECRGEACLAPTHDPPFPNHCYQLLYRPYRLLCASYMLFSHSYRLLFASYVLLFHSYRFLFAPYALLYHSCLSLYHAFVLLYASYIERNLK